MFDQKWFSKHQKLLLYLLNAPIIRSWFRYVLRIYGKRSSVGKRPIYKIETNAITWIDKILGYSWVNGKKYYRVRFLTEFRTHNKFSKRLFYAFRPIWLLAHAWDTLFANNFQPAWNLGFDTLTVYPDPHTETTSVDGIARRGWVGVNEIFATIRAGAGTVAVDDSTTEEAPVLTASTTTNQYLLLTRPIFLFDTSDLTANANISATVLSIDITGKLAGIGETPLDIVSSNPASNTALVAADYTTLGTTKFASIAFASIITTGYNDFTLDANGIANISKTGISKFGARLGWDTDNNFTGTWADSANTRFNPQFADTTGTANDPKLVVTYTIGVGTVGWKSLLGVGQG